ncbi:hypothetical protein [Cetobacterium sp.]|uniref:hypothetical protein n=1 Tax=Cetobacterium sp. TaxID=2071632 RepID=UPI003F3DC108
MKIKYYEDDTIKKFNELNGEDSTDIKEKLNNETLILDTKNLKNCLSANNHNSFNKNFKENLFGIHSENSSDVNQYPTTEYRLNAPEGLAKFWGGVLAPNKKIYFTPYDFNGVLEFDTESEAIVTFNGGLDIQSGGNKWRGGVLGPDGKIYFIPYNENCFLVLNPENNSLEKKEILINSPKKFCGGIVAKNGKIYCIPSSYNKILCYDPITNTSTEFGNLNSTEEKYRGGVLSPNGKIYCVPFNASSILIIDPETNTTETLGEFGEETEKWSGGVIDNYKNIIFTCYSANHLLKIDTNNNKIEKIFSDSVSLDDKKKWISCILGTNKHIYLIQFNASSLRYIDIEDNYKIYSSRLSGGQYNGENFSGAIVFENNCFAFIPYSQNFLYVLKRKNFRKIEKNIFLSNYFNKF